MWTFLFTSLDGRESPDRLTVRPRTTAWTGHRKPVICITPVAIWARIRPRHPVFVMESNYISSEEAKQTEATYLTNGAGWEFLTSLTQCAQTIVLNVAALYWQKGCLYFGQNQLSDET